MKDPKPGRAADLLTGGRRLRQGVQMAWPAASVYTADITREEGENYAESDV